MTDTPKTPDEELEEILTTLENTVQNDIALRQSQSKSGRSPKSIHAEALAKLKAREQRIEILARIDENQIRLDKIIEHENHKPKPGELTSANFGSASGAMEVVAFKKSFESRIAQLKNTPTPNKNSTGSSAKWSDSRDSIADDGKEGE